VDIIAYLAQEISGLPKNQVFGTGMGLDSARLRSNLAKRFNVESEQVDGLLWASMAIVNLSLGVLSALAEMVKDMLSEEEMKNIEETVKKRSV